MDRKQKLALVWKGMHKDYKGKIDGEKTVLVYRNGTTLIRLDDMTDKEINDRLPKELRETE